MLSTILLLEHCGWNTLELWRLSAIKQVSISLFELYYVVGGGAMIFKGQVNVTHLLHGIDRYFLGECHQDFDVI